MHSHAKTTTGVHQAVAQDLIVANNNFEHLLELEWRKKKYACSQMLLVT